MGLPASRPFRQGETIVWTVGAPALFVVLWSTGFVFAKESLNFAEPTTVLALRFGLAAVLTLGLAVGAGASWPSRRLLLHVVVVGLLIHGCFIGGVFAAIYRGLPASLSALIVGLQPLLSACVVGLALGERVTPEQWVGFVLGLGGVALVLSSKLTFDRATVGSVLLAVLALFGITAGTLYQKRFCAQVDVRSGQAVQYAVAAVAMLVLALAFGSLHIEWTASFVGSLAWMVIVLSTGTMSLLYVIIRHGAAVKTASLFYLVPPITALFAFLWFGETLGPTALAGMAVAAAGVALVQRGRLRGAGRATIRPGVE